MADDPKTAGSENTGATSVSPTTEGLDQNRVPYDRFAQVVNERNASRDQIAVLQAQVNALNNAKLVEQEDYKTLAAQAQDAAKTAQEEASARSKELLRFRVSVEAGLPQELANRLQGDSFEEMLADANRLREVVPMHTAAATDAGQPGGQPAVQTLSADEQTILGTFNKYLDPEDRLTSEQYLKLRSGWNPVKPAGMDDPTPH